jgi:PTH1 family peptidyl-tRNA hydrolase
MAMDVLVRVYGFAPWRKKFQSECADGEIAGVKCLALKPQTYMNESGRAIAEALKFYKLLPADLVVFHDEIDMAPGRFRMKMGGGVAGHNGLRSIAAHIGPDFRRARMGVGHPGDKDRVYTHVLSDFAKSEQGWVEALCEACAKAAPFLVAGENNKYQAEVMRLAPATKADPRKSPLSES